MKAFEKKFEYMILQYDPKSFEELRVGHYYGNE